MQQELRIREPCMAGGLAKSCFVTEFIRVPARIPAQPRVAMSKDHPCAGNHDWPASCVAVPAMPAQIHFVDLVLAVAMTQQSSEVHRRDCLRETHRPL